jgi:hypothetical protein
MREEDVTAALQAAAARRDAVRLRCCEHGRPPAGLVRELLAAEVDADVWCRITQRVLFHGQAPVEAFAAEYDALLADLIRLAACGDGQARPVAEWLAAHAGRRSLRAVSP